MIESFNEKSDKNFTVSCENTLSKITLSKITLSKITLPKITLSKITLSKITLSKITLSKSMKMITKEVVDHFIKNLYGVLALFTN
jgi:hypothetical protein